MKTYLVGGAVRDKLLGIEPKERDWVVVGSSPEGMKSQGYIQKLVKSMRLRGLRENQAMVIQVLSLT